MANPFHDTMRKLHSSDRNHGENCDSDQIAEGRLSDAHRLTAQVIALRHQQGLSDADDEDCKALALDLMQAGDVEEGGKIFK